MVNDNKDNAAILSLFQLGKRLVALGMGEKGKITRVMTPFLGAEFTFASPDQGEGTAPGQITTERMKGVFNELRKNGIIS
jgi:3-dehydroquinate dehydratase-1